MDEVTRRLNRLLRTIRGVVGVASERLALDVIGIQRHLVPGVVRCRHAVLVLGIDIATAETRLDVDEVELDDAGDITPIGTRGTGRRLVDELQVHTRCQCHLVVAGSIVTVAVGRSCGLPVVV